MITVRIWFEKRNEASYISLLDLQRVMQRVLKRSGLPVWHTLGFNPHIYMTFTCPLSLGQESLCESVDVKTEAEAPDFAAWQAALNAIMPAGIRVWRVEPAKDKASAIAYACYTISYPAEAAEKLAGYNALDAAPAEKKGKKGTKQIDLKAYVPALANVATVVLAASLMTSAKSSSLSQRVSSSIWVVLPAPSSPSKEISFPAEALLTDYFPRSVRYSS